MISIGRKTVCILGLTIYKTVCGRIAIQEKKSLRKLKTGRGRLGQTYGASITLIVAPTDTTSMYIDVPTSFFALAEIFP